VWRLQVAMWHLVSREAGLPLRLRPQEPQTDPLGPWWFVISGQGWTSC
jgi:hypothetical protein